MSIAGIDDVENLYTFTIHNKYTKFNCKELVYDTNLSEYNTHGKTALN